MKIVRALLFFHIINHPSIALGNSIPFHLNCSWVDDKIFRGVTDNDTIMIKTPLPDINFHFSKLENSERVLVFRPEFMRIDPKEEFFTISKITPHEIIVQECMEANNMSEESYITTREFFGLEIN